MKNLALCGKGYSATTPLAGTEVVPIVQSSTTKNVSVANLTAGRSISTAGASLDGAVVINESGANVDMRVEGDTDNNLLFVDASADRIGVGTATPNGKFDVLLSASRHLTTKYDTNITLSAENDGGNPENMRLYGENIRLYTPQGGFTAANLTLGAELKSTSGDFQLYTGNLVQGTAAKGINFTANTPASGMTSQLLNWYEEGTWTPLLSDGTNNATNTGNTAAHYTRIGNTVNIWCRVQISSLGSVSGAVRVTGLPFTAKNVQSNYGGISMGLAGGMAIAANQVPTGIFIPNASYIALYLWDATTGTTTLQSSELTASADLYFFGSYQAA
jgi:hypothetical protein